MKSTLAAISSVSVPQSASPGAGTRSQRAPNVLWWRGLFRAIWLVLVPLLLAALAIHYLSPSAFDTGSPLLELLAQVSSEQSVASVVVLFLLFASVLKYWRFYLPGLRQFSALSWGLEPTLISAALLRAWEPCAEQLEVLGQKSCQRSIQGLSAEQQGALEAAQLALRASLAERDLPRARVLAGNLKKLVTESKILQREQLKLLFGAVGVVLLVLFVRNSVLEPYRVLSGSMLPGLEPGDWILANKLPYGLRVPFTQLRLLGRAPSRGDVIAFDTPPTASAGQPARLVKRVIGLPGDRVGLHHGQPVINGVQVPSCDAGVYAYLSSDAAVRGRLEVEFLGEQAYLTVYFAGSDPFVGYEVKPGEVFVLGDNRNNSSDSRSWNNHQGGGLPLAAIEGRVSTILVGSSRDGRADWTEILQPLRREIRLEGMDLSELKAGIERCLKNPPNASAPPP